MYRRKYQLDSKNVSKVSVSLRAFAPQEGQDTEAHSSAAANGFPFSRV